MKKISLLASRLLALLLVVGSLGLNSCKSTDETTVNGDWTKSSAFSGAGRNGAATFTINGIAYVATGIDINSNKYADLWSFNPASGGWTQLANFPGVARYNAVGFAAGGRGYVGTGYDGANYLGDFYEYNPATNQWRKVADIPQVSNGLTTVAGRTGAVAASVSDIGYVGCGYNGNYLKDFYSYTPNTAGLGTWAPLAQGFPGDKRQGGVAFTIGTQFYVGTGLNNGANTTDFWSYNPQGGAWTQKRNLANTSNSTDSYDYSAVQRTNAVAFTVNGLGYIVTGSNGTVLTTCYEYDPTADSWTVKNPFLGSGRTGGIGFGVGNFGYVGLGNSGSTRFDDFWKFDPSASQE